LLLAVLAELLLERLLLACVQTGLNGHPSAAAAPHIGRCYCALLLRFAALLQVVVLPANRGCAAAQRAMQSQRAACCVCV